MTSTQTPPDDKATVSLPSHAPNLIVIGAMKASTTTFYETICRHPQVWFPDEKEPHYITSSEFGEAAAWQKYLRLFSAAPPTARVVGEASTGYSKLPHFGNTPQRLRDMLGELKLIYLVRDPVGRTISNFQHAYLAGHYAAETTLAEALESDRILLDASLYGRQVSAYHEVFDPDQLLVISVDQLHAETATVMQRVEAFLDLPPYDGWAEPLPQTNSKHALGRSLAARALVPTAVLNVVKSVIPPALRRWLKGATQRSITLPAETEADRAQIFAEVREDLTEFVALAGDELSHCELREWIDRWPSVQKLRTDAVGEGS